MKLNTSWKTNTAGIAVILAGVANLVVAAIQHGSVTPEAAGIAVTAVISGIGLLNAKDGNVSNSPTPLQVAQPVEQTLEAAIGGSMCLRLPRLSPLRKRSRNKWCMTGGYALPP